MLLKRIDIMGFKSFPEKTEIKLSPGITVIIGPNGCGKSNLVDSIRWVLGEQSVKLMRGNKMEELIFSGTATRKPLNFADVSVVFEEVDKFLPVEYQEISVSRRMYRSGEGEYHLNKKPCRLKDINELFLDTGIGMETYSLIGQGRVEQLINARPEEHRELFEEAAKIHKYKQRKKEARGKLDEMHRNLIRVDDLLAEYQGQTEHLSEEADRAREYKQLQDQCKFLDKQILLKQWAENKAAYDKMEAEVNRINHTLQEKSAAIHQLTEKMKQSELQELDALNQLEEAKRHYQEQKETLDSLQNQVYLARQQIKYNMEKITYKEESYQEVQGRINGLNETIQNNQQDLNTVQEEQKQLGEQASKLTERLNNMQRGQSLAQVESLRESLAGENQKMAVLQQKLQDYEQRLEEIQQQKQETEKLIHAQEQVAKELAEKKGQSLEQLQKLEQDKFELQTRQEQLESQWNKNNAVLSKKRELLRNLGREIEKKKGRFRFLKESEEGFSFFSDGVKAVMQWASSNSLQEGIYGPFIQLIQVSPQYEKAIEVALGASTQFIVVADEGYARRAIEHLKMKQAGKATFLPLDMLKVSRREIPSRSMEGLVDRASQLVQTASQYKKAVDYLLGGTLIAKNLECAVNMAKGLSGWRVVTLDGEMITPGGAISGGVSSRQSAGFLASKRERQNLEQELNKLDQREKNELKQVQELEGSIKEVESSLNIVKQEIADLAGKENNIHYNLEHLEADLKRETEAVDAARKDKENLEQRWDHLVKEKAAREEELAACDSSIDSFKEQIKELNQKVKREDEEYKKTEEERVEVRVRFSAFQEKESSLQDMLQKQKQEKERLAELSNSLKQEKRGLEEELEKNQTREQSLLHQLEQEKEKSATLETKVEGLEQSAKKQKLEKEEAQSLLEKEKRSLERFQKRSQSLEIEIVRYREAIRYLTEQLLEKYRVDPRKDLSQKQEAEISRAELEKEKQKLENEMDAMGEVDLSVIEEYEKLQQRIHFLTEQRKDLVEGEKGVKSVLNELDQYMEKQFMEALQAIERNFKEIFKKLFGGGQAMLKLTDPDNVLESGIEIVAQPPGKKLQTISLLSGGEKALTAIGLLFAILQYKPVPFCVLDEIDSSLDENNLNSFLQFLKDYSNETQFVVITHRRRTMEEADVLYGVTMEEQGISKIVSINLSQKAG